MVVEHSADQASFDRVILNQQNRFDRSFNDPIHHAGNCSASLGKHGALVALGGIRAFLLSQLFGKQSGLFCTPFGRRVARDGDRALEDPKQY